MYQMTEKLNGIVNNNSDDDEHAKHAAVYSLK